MLNQACRTIPDFQPQVVSAVLSCRIFCERTGKCRPSRMVEVPKCVVLDIGRGCNNHFEACLRVSTDVVNIKFSARPLNVSDDVRYPIHR